MPGVNVSTRRKSDKYRCIAATMASGTPFANNAGGIEKEGHFVKSVLNDGLREKLDLLRQVAPEKIVAMYQELALEYARELPLRPTSFSRMIDAIIEHGDARLLE
jgi:hypothetical protein